MSDAQNFLENTRRIINNIARTLQGLWQAWKPKIVRATRKTLRVLRNVLLRVTLITLTFLSKTLNYLSKKLPELIEKLSEVESRIKSEEAKMSGYKQYDEKEEEYESSSIIQRFRRRK